MLRRLAPVSFLSYHAISYIHAYPMCTHDHYFIPAHVCVLTQEVDNPVEEIFVSRESAQSACQSASERICAYFLNNFVIFINFTTVNSFKLITHEYIIIISVLSYKILVSEFYYQIFLNCFILNIHYS